MIVKVHKSPENRIIVAICDKDLFGKKFEEGKLQLDLSSDFYNGEEKNIKEIADLIRNADIINLVGEKSVQLGLTEEIISDEDVKKIDNIPYSQTALE